MISFTEFKRLEPALRNPHSTVFGELPEEVRGELCFLPCEIYRSVGWRETGIARTTNEAFRLVPSFIHPDDPANKPVVREPVYVEKEADSIGLVMLPEGTWDFADVMAANTMYHRFAGYRYGSEYSPTLRFNADCTLIVPDAVRFLVKEVVK